jgi:hypothetical protein
MNDFRKFRRFPIRMKPHRLLIPALLAASFLSHAQDLPGAAVAEWVRQLADENFQVRERASLELWELGEAALPALEAAVSSPDPEQAIRAREIVRKIQLHVTPDTDASVISLVERYAVASPAEKTSLMAKMRGKRAWRQMLKLYAAEADAGVRQRLESTIGAVALKAARERLLQGDDATAREFLELAPANEEGLRTLAEFHRSHGTLQAELERANNLKDAKGAAWRMALHSADGNLTAARDEALAAGDPARAAILSALAGDPLPALRLSIQNEDDNPLRAAYARIAIKRWQDQKIRPADLDFLRRTLASRDPGESGSAIGALFLLGEHEMAEQALAKSQPLAAYVHFDALERIPEALQAFGLDPEKPDYPAWVGKRFKQALDADVADQHGVSDIESEVWALANFMERRGLHAEAVEAFGGPMAALAESDSERFGEALSRLFGATGAPRVARVVALQWAGEDDERWDEVVTAAFGDDDQVTAWWNWLGEIQPKAKRAERLDAMLALFDVCPDPADRRGKWLPLLWQAVDAAPPGERQLLAGRIYEMASQTGAGDVATAMRAWEKLAPEGRDKVFFGQQLYQFSALDRWDDAADLVMKQFAVMKEDGQEPGADLHAYAAATLRMAGREQQASEHDGWVDKLSLGNAKTAFTIANGYAYGRDYQRAAEWWRRAVIQSGNQSEDITNALKFYTDHLLETRQWRETAALSELLALQYVGSEYLYASYLPLMRFRLQADTARALAGLGQNRDRSLGLLEQCHRMFASDGSLADFFFPALREAGLLKQHDAWFRESWKQFDVVIRRFPEADNVRNTAAWFASRALRELAAAERHVRKALELNPRQSAYLDTMAEIQFAKGQRDKALEWSNLAINYLPEDIMLRRQHERFRSASLPK